MLYPGPVLPPTRWWSLIRATTTTCAWLVPVSFRPATSADLTHRPFPAIGPIPCLRTVPEVRPEAARASCPRPAPPPATASSLPGELCFRIGQGKNTSKPLNFCDSVFYTRFIPQNCFLYELATRDGDQQDFGEDNFVFRLANNFPPRYFLWEGICTIWWGGAHQGKITTFVSPQIPLRGLTYIFSSPGSCLEKNLALCRPLRHCLMMLAMLLDTLY